MDYNYNYSNAYSDPYFTSTSFDEDITNPVYHNFNQPSMSDWSYLNQYMPQSQYYEQDWNIHHYSSQSQWGYNSPKSYCQPPFQHSASKFSSHDQPIEEKSEVIKSIEAMIESQEQKLKMMDSQFPQNFQIQYP